MRSLVSLLCLTSLFSSHVLALPCDDDKPQSTENSTTLGAPSPSSNVSSGEAPKKVTLLHTNDIHAHLDEFNAGGIDCRQEDRDSNHCVGGIGRMKTIIDAYRKNTSDVLLFDAGDMFQGTLFFNVYGGWPGAQLMNELKYDAMTIGNHEFDRGVDYLASFFHNLTFPVISSNIDFETAPQLRDAGVKPYIILDKYKLGVIGFITPTTANISNTAKNVTFNDPVKVVQGYVDELHAKGIKRIICVSHNGYSSDMEVASRTRGVQLIVGGHSHSLLLKNSSVSGVEGPYPTEVKNLDNKTTWIVQAHRFGDYLGHLELEWGDNDDLVSLKGDPILLDKSIPQDKTIQDRVNEWRQGFAHITSEILATSTGQFSNAKCKSTFDCPMGNLISDCMMETRGNVSADMAFQNSGGIRAAFSSGNVSFGDVMTVLPFDNYIVAVNLTGEAIYHTMERVATLREKGSTMISPPHFSVGVRYIVNTSAPVQHRVVLATLNGVPIQRNKTYTVLTNDFVADGGDDIIPKSPVGLTKVLMADMMKSCLLARKVIQPTQDIRMIRLP